MLVPQWILCPLLRLGRMFPPISNSVTELHSASQDTTVIIGGGIIGLSTAYSMLQDQRERSLPVPHIVVLDSAHELFAGASGGAAGILGSYGFKEEAVELGNLSWNMFKSLNQEHNGRTNWNWSEIVIRNASHSKDGPPGHGKAIARPLPTWFRNESNQYIHWIAGPDHAARMQVTGTFKENSA